MTITLLAHGSPDPRHSRDVEALAERLTRSATPARAAYLEHNEPSPNLLARELDVGGTFTTVVPLLVTPAYHARVDVPEAIARMRAAAAGLEVRAAEPVGLDPLLVAAAGQLAGGIGALAERPGYRLDHWTGLLVAGTGSRDPRAVRAVTSLIHEHAGSLAATLGIRAALPAFLDGGPSIPDAAAALRASGCRTLLAVTLVVADGILRDRIVAHSRELGIPVAPGTLTSTPAMAQLVRLRAEATSMSLSA
jgi:sirohydrochlorin ferrochelatase